MTQLLSILPRKDPSVHAIFLHGLSGHYLKTWTNKGGEVWLKWLEEIEGLAVWSVAYGADATNWQLGDAQHLVDRGQSVLASLLEKEELQSGYIALIGHSFGGLVIKQVLRLAHDKSSKHAKASSFLQRVRKVAFLGTPHTGAGLASFAGAVAIITRPSAVLRSLSKDDPGLRDLGNWYRESMDVPHVEHLVLFETRASGLLKALGRIVSPSSANPGLSSTTPVPVDATHSSICKPTDRDSFVYRQVAQLLRSPIKDPAKQLTTETGLLTKLGATLGGELPQQHASVLAQVRFATAASDEIVRARVHELRRARLIPGFDALGKARNLLDALLLGSLAGAGESASTSALAWCLRVLCDDPDAVASIQRELAGRAESEELRVARAICRSYAGDWQAEVPALLDVNSRFSTTGAVLIVARALDAATALEWFRTCRIPPQQLDADGKTVVLQMALSSRDWDLAEQIASSVVNEDYEVSPMLLRVHASANMASCAPEELRHVLVEGEPFDLRRYPLRGDEESLRRILSAVALLGRFTVEARALELHRIADEAADTALWLRLKHPREEQAALNDLKGGMREVDFSVRNLNLAVQWGIPIDPTVADRRIMQVEARYAGRATSATATARLNLGISIGGVEGFRYLERNKAVITSAIDADSLQGIQLDLLRAACGQQDPRVFSDKLVSEAILSPALARKLADCAANTPDSDVDSRLASLNPSTPLGEIIRLASDLEHLGHPEAARVATALFDRTLAPEQALRAARLCLEYHQDERVLHIAQALGEAGYGIAGLQSALAWAHFRLGNLQEAALILDENTGRIPSTELRTLRMNIAVSTGAWNQLHADVEAVWSRKCELSASELLTGANTALSIGSSRAFDLAKAAVDKGQNSPDVLINAYSIAVRLGEEARDEVADWLKLAVEQSDENGPIRPMDLRAVLDQQAIWSTQRENVFEHLRTAGVPLFIAAQGLRTSLLNIYLGSAIHNADERDPRKRSLIPAFSGTPTQSFTRVRRLGLDPTALLTLAYVDRLDLVGQLCEEFVIAHTTLPWLFEQRQSLTHHQPSRVSKAAELQRLAAAGDIAILTQTAIASLDEIKKLGESYSSLIEVARGATEHTAVVVGGPIHKHGSLLTEVADLTPYRPQLVSCLEVLSELERRGALTVAERTRARSFLGIQIQPFAPEDSLRLATRLILDDVALGYFQHLSLLDKFELAGLKVVVTMESFDEAKALTEHRRETQQALAVVERLRAFLESSLSSGSARLLPLLSASTGSEDLQREPTAQLLLAAEQSRFDTLLVDDRFANQFRSTDTVSISSSLEFLAAGAAAGLMTVHEHVEVLTKLRRAQYFFVPLSLTELKALLGQATVVEGVMVETAELKVVRENLLRLRSTSMLAIPRDAEAFVRLISILRDAIGWVWSVDSAGAAVAKSTWLMSLADIRDWAHLYPEDAAAMIRRAISITLLIPLVIEAGKERAVESPDFEGWLWNSVLEPMRSDYPFMYTDLVDTIADLVCDAAEAPEGAGD